jgi:predicted ATP-grasp superfamily ATP-dependent carboligase
MSGRSVLILDAGQRSALAATRALGKRGIRVLVADDRAETLAGASRYCEGRLTYASPLSDPTGFLADLTEHVRRLRIDTLFPMTDVTTSLVLRHRSEFADLVRHLPSLDAYEAVTDKGRLVDLARRLGVSVPRTLPVGDAADLRAACRALSFPIVLKPSRSQIWADGRCVGTSVRYARSAE